MSEGAWEATATIPSQVAEPVMSKTRKGTVTERIQFAPWEIRLPSQQDTNWK